MDLSAYGSLNATVYGISGDNPFAQEAWAQKENINVPLLSDYEHKVAKAYDVAYDSFLPQINLGMGGVPKRVGLHRRSQRRDSIRGERRRRARVAEFRQDESEAGGAEMISPRTQGAKDLTMRPLSSSSPSDDNE